MPRKCLTDGCTSPEWQLQKNGYCVPCNTTMRRFQKRSQVKEEQDYEKAKQLELQERIKSVEKQTYNIATGDAVPDQWKQVKTRAEVLEEKRRHLDRQRRSNSQGGSSGGESEGDQDQGSNRPSINSDSSPRRGSISFVGRGAWVCSKCKFRNDPSDSKCEVCDTPNPKAANVESDDGLVGMRALDLITADFVPQRRSVAARPSASSDASTRGSNPSGNKSTGNQGGGLNTSEDLSRQDSYSTGRGLNAGATAVAVANALVVASAVVDAETARAASRHIEQLKQGIDKEVIDAITKEDDLSFPRPRFSRDPLPVGQWYTGLFDCFAPPPEFITKYLPSNLSSHSPTDSNPDSPSPSDGTKNGSIQLAHGPKASDLKSSTNNPSGSASVRPALSVASSSRHQKEGDPSASRTSVEVQRKNTRTALVAEGKLKQEVALVMEAYQCSTCLTSCLIPCHQVTRNMEEFIGPEGDAHNECCVAWVCGLPPCCCIYMTAMRRKIATGYRTESSCITDCIYSTCCYPCSLSQQYREIAIRREHSARRRSFSIREGQYDRARQVRLLARLQREAAHDDVDVELADAGAALIAPPPVTMERPAALEKHIQSSLAKESGNSGNHIRTTGSGGSYASGGETGGVPKKGQRHKGEQDVSGPSHGQVEDDDEDDDGGDSHDSGSLEPPLGGLRSFAVSNGQMQPIAPKAALPPLGSALGSPRASSNIISKNLPASYLKNSRGSMNLSGSGPRGSHVSQGNPGMSRPISPRHQAQQHHLGASTTTPNTSTDRRGSDLDPEAGDDEDNFDDE